MDNNLLKGKTVLFLGDSITAGAGAYGPDTCFVNVFGKLSGANVVNYGVCGTRIAFQDEEKSGGHFGERADKMQDTADYVVVFGGTNDFGHGRAPFGDFSDRTDDTFCGAFYNLLTKLYNKYPLARIMVIPPLHRLSEDAVINERGIPCKPLIDYVNAERKICDELSVPMLDLYKNGNMQPKIEALNKAFFFDGLHPNDAGHLRIAKALYNFIVNTLE